MGNQRWQENKSGLGNQAHQICRTHLSAYRDTLKKSTHPTVEDASLKFAQDLVNKYSNTFNNANTEGIANPDAVGKHLNALLRIAQGTLKADKTYIEDLQDIFLDS